MRNRTCQVSWICVWIKDVDVNKICEDERDYDNDDDGDDNENNVDDVPEMVITFKFLSLKLLLYRKKLLLEESFTVLWFFGQFLNICESLFLQNTRKSGYFDVASKND